jgi:formate dehydrogenase beta subunit
MDGFLEGSGIIDEKLAPESEPEKSLGPGEGFASMNRCETQHVLPERRILNFCKVVQELDDDEATYESMRCLQCDLRLKIATVKVWGNY